jgi:hypothetical protein
MSRATVNWAAMYKTLLGELVALSAQGAVPDAELRARLEALITETQKRKPPSRASLVREGLIDGIRPVRSLLVAIAKLPWQATGEHPAIEYLAKLQALYLKGSRKLPVEVVAPSLGMIWQVSISSPDRERAFQALEVATLFALRRAVRNGSVWIEHSLSFRGRARLFFTDERWQAESKKHYARLSLPQQGCHFLEAFAGQSKLPVSMRWPLQPAVAYCAWMMNSICRHCPQRTKTPEVDQAARRLWITASVRFNCRK